MNGYFGALMRSSGLTVGARPSMVAAAEHGMTETSVERSADVAQPAASRVPSPPRQAVAPIPTHDPAEVTPPAPRAADHAREARYGYGPTDQVGDRAAVPVPASSPEAPTPSAADPSMPLDHAMIRAALKWVQAAPPRAQSADAVPSREQAPPSIGQEPSAIITTEVIRERGGERQPQVTIVTPDTAVALYPAPDETASQVLANPSPRQATPNAPPSVQPMVRDERVEISIGAIHVRVDAPPAQTIARPASSPPGAAPLAAPPASQRSALSRRPLRRI